VQINHYMNFEMVDAVILCIIYIYVVCACVRLLIICLYTQIKVYSCGKCFCMMC